MRARRAARAVDLSVAGRGDAASVPAVLGDSGGRGAAWRLGEAAGGAGGEDGDPTWNCWPAGNWTRPCPLPALCCRRAAACARAEMVTVLANMAESVLEAGDDPRGVQGDQLAPGAGRDRVCPPVNPGPGPRSPTPSPRCGSTTCGTWAGQLRWGQLTHARAAGILRNPAYAGA